MTKQQNYSSAFSLFDHAELRIDNFGQPMPVGVIEGIMFYGDQIRYRVALFVNDAPADKQPNPFLHEGRLIDGFVERDLVRYGYDNFASVKESERRPQYNLNLARAKFQIGDLVSIRIQISDQEQQDYHNIPVLLTAVRYEEGKVLYDVSIDRAAYIGTDAENTNIGRLVIDELTNIDGVFIEPVGGWHKYLGMPETSSIEVNGSDVKVMHKPEPSAVNISVQVKGTVSGRSSGTEPNESAKPRSE